MKHNTFFQYLEHERRFSPNTLLAYERDLKQFFSYLKEQYDTDDVNKIKHFHIRSWMVELMKRKVVNKSINRKLSCLRSYFKFEQKKGLTTNPMKKIVAPKTGKKLPIYVLEDAMEKVLDPDNYTKDFKGERDRMIMELLYGLGIRRSELIGLKESSIDFNQSAIKVLGKGNKERIIPFSANLGKMLVHYLEIREIEFGTKLGNLFLTEKAKPLYPKFLYNVVSKYLSLVPTLEQKSPHVMRHSFATHLANKGADLNAIKELLGHSSLAATQVYTHNSIEQLIHVYQNAHPKGE